jgi:uncharacterized repeat protein (TIGR01451 family)
MTGLLVHLSTGSVGCASSRLNGRLVSATINTLVRRGQKLACLLLLTMALLPNVATAAPPAGASIDNTAQLNFDAFGYSLVILSNTVSTATVPLPTPGVVELLRYAANPAGTTVPATSFSSDGASTGVFSTILPTPDPGDLTPGTIFSGSELVVIRLSDSDRNLDAILVDTIELTIRSTMTGDFEYLRLTETGPDTGVFLGSLPLAPAAAVGFDGQLYSAIDDTLTVDYRDPINGDGSSDEALVDPYGTVFDSFTGTPVDGVEVTLIDNATGVEATTVVGDDGVAFPGHVITGSSFTIGTVTYNFPPGGYRFPLIPAGDYSLKITPLASYNFPSTNPAPAGGYVVLAPDSYGGVFTISPGPAIRIDVPLDPTATAGILWLQKSADRSSIGIGETLAYSVSVTNTDTAVVPAVTITDRLPFGFSYRDGSARSSTGTPLTPVLSADGRSLTFTVGDLAAGATAVIRYAVAVGAGAKPGQAINRARAASTVLPAIISNEGRAGVEVIEDLFRSESFLIGRVFDGDCDADETTLSGLGGIRIYLEDGSNVVTDDTGRYHFVSVQPGSHVVQLDTETIPVGYEILDCENDSRSAGRPESRFIDVQQGALWRVDFHLARKPINGEVTIALDNEFGTGSAATYTVNLSGREIPLFNRRLQVELPAAVEYLPGSSELSGEALADPQHDGKTLIFALPERSGDWQETVRFRTLIDSSAETTEMPASAHLVFDTRTDKDLVTPAAESSLVWISRSERREVQELLLQPRFATLEATLSTEDLRAVDAIVAELQKLDLIKIVVVGHTDARSIRWREGIAYRDNGELSTARAEAVAKSLAAALPLSAEQIVVRGMAAAEPIASNTTVDGMAKNRRTDLRVLHRVVVDPALDQMAADAGPAQSITASVRPQPAAAKASALSPGILYPADGSTLAQPISAIGVRLDSTLKPRLLLDTVEIAPGKIGATLADSESGQTTYTYIGVDLGAPGAHNLVLQGIDPFGNPRFEQTIKLLRTGGIASLVVADVAGNVADGRTPLQIRLQALDEQGSVLATPFTVEIHGGDLRPWRNQVGAFDQPESASTIDVGEDGIVRFAPVMASGRYQSQLVYVDQTIDLTVDVGGEQRKDWILVGLAEGTVGYNTISGNMESAADVEEDLYNDGRVAFYAKGKVQGKWLVTAAYDSARPNREGRSLHDDIDPNRYYLLYGDASVQHNDASTSRNLFLKIERDQFYALFGDFDTGLTVTELSRYSRSLTGVKTEWHGKQGDAVAFASDTGQAFVRDEIQGDGTSGLYRLSHTLIVENSDKLMLETRDRFRSDVVLLQRPLTRYVDYDLDPYSGTLFFKAPVPSRDADFNPIFIVVDYEVPSGSESAMTYGGRAATRLGNRAEIGATYVREELGSKKGSLYGSDVTLNLTDATVLRAELARTENRNLGVDNNATAWLTELKHSSNRFNSQVWWREQESGFGLGQTSAGEDSTRKIGAQADYQLNKQLGVEGLISREERIDTNAWRNVIEGAVTLQQAKSNLRVGARRAEDRLADGSHLPSNQVFAGSEWQPLRRLNLQARHEQAIGNNENVDYPTRTLLGAEFKVMQPLSIYGEQEFIHSDSGGGNSSRLGLRSTPWQGGRIDSSVQRTVNDDNSSRLLALFGLQQSWQVKRWTLDFSFDRAQALSNSTDRYNPAVPGAAADDDFTALALGGATEGENWKWWNRAEFRTSDSEDRYGLASGITGRIQPGVGLGARTTLYRSERAGGNSNNVEISLSGVWRPDRSRWILLDRLDTHSEQTGGSGGSRSWRVINNLHANYKPDRINQLSFQYGCKFVSEDLLDQTWSGYTDLLSAEYRRDLGQKWDVGVHGGALHTWEIGQIDWRSGGSVGYNPAENLWVSLGYNVTGYRDDDFAQGNYTAQGPYLNFRFKFDQTSVKDALSWIDRL